MMTRLHHQDEANLGLRREPLFTASISEAYFSWRGTLPVRSFAHFWSVKIPSIYSAELLSLLSVKQESSNSNPTGKMQNSNRCSK
jgi:hypothetical protein